MVASVCPAPKCRWLKSLGIGSVQIRQLGVDQEVVVPGIGFIDARRRHAHVGKTKVNGNVLRDHRPLLQTNEMDLGVSRCRRSDRRVHDTDLDARRNDRRRVRNVILVSQEQLKRMLPGFQRDLGLGLAAAEMEMVEVTRNGLIERRQLAVDTTHVALSTGVAELHDEPAVVLVDSLAEFPPERNAFIAMDGRVVRDHASADQHRYERRDDRTNSASNIVRVELGQLADAYGVQPPKPSPPG